MADTNGNYKPTDSIVHGLPAVLVGAAAMILSGVFGSHNITLDTSTISGGLIAILGIVQGVIHMMQNKGK